MNHAYERHVKFLELQIAPDGEDPSGVHVDLKALLTQVEKDGFPLKKPRSNQKQVKRPQAIAWFQQGGVEHAALLWSSVDANAIDACYQELAGSALERTSKKDGFGDRREAHLVIRLAPRTVGKFRVYQMALEESLGLGSSVVSEHLGSMLRKVGKKKIYPKNSEPKTIHPEVHIKGLLPKDMFEQLEKSGVDGFTLVRDFETSSKFDKPAELVTERQVLELTVVGERNKGWLKRVMAQVKKRAQDEDFNRIRVHYFDSNAQKNKTATLDQLLSGTVGNKAEQLFSRSCKISLSERMNHDHDSVVVSFAKLVAKKMHEEFDG